MAIENEELTEAECAKIKKGELKITVRERPGGLEFIGEGAIGDTSYVAVASRLADIVLRNAKNMEPHSRVMLEAALMMLNHLCGFDEKASYGVNRTVERGPGDDHPVGNA